MTDHTDPIDELVQAANPVPRERPLDPALLSHVAERIEERRSPSGGERRSTRAPRLRVLAAGAAAAAIAAAAFGLNDALRDPAQGPSVALGNPTAICIEFTDETLAAFPVAFDGRVTAVEGEQVTFDVETWFRGGQGDTVTVAAPDLVEHSAALVGGIGFEEGERYLVSGDRQDGRIVPAVCGFTLTWSEEMAETFRRAFGRSP